MSKIEQDTSSAARESEAAGDDDLDERLRAADAADRPGILAACIHEVVGDETILHPETKEFYRQAGIIATKSSA